MRLQHKRLILLHFSVVVYKLIKANLQLLRGCMLKLKRHLSASSRHSTTTKGATTIIAATIITTIEAATTTGHQHKSDFKAIVDLPSPTNATPRPPSGPAKGLIVRPFTRYLCVPPSALAISFLPAPPAAAFGQFPFEWDFSIFHRINILSLSLSFSLSFVSLSLCLYSCVFVRFVFVVLVVVVGALPITKCLLCLVRVAPRSSPSASPSSMSRLI